MAMLYPMHVPSVPLKWNEKIWMPPSGIAMELALLKIDEDINSIIKEKELCINLTNETASLRQERQSEEDGMMDDSKNNRNRQGGINGQPQFRILQRPPDQQPMSRLEGLYEGRSNGLPVPPTLKDVEICLNGPKVLFRDSHNCNYEINVQTTERPTGCFVTVRKLYNSKKLEFFDVMCAYLFRNAEQDAWKEAAEELIGQYPIYHTAPHRVPVSKHSIPFLESHSIRKLDQFTKSFPEAVYYCHLCHHHIVSVKSARKHFEVDHMNELERIQARSNFVEGCRNLPPELYMALERKISEFIPDVTQDDENILLTELRRVQRILENILDISLGEGHKYVLDPFGSLVQQCHNKDSPFKFSLRCEDLLNNNTPPTLKILTEAIHEYQEKNSFMADASLSTAFTPTIIGSLEGRKFVIVYRGMSQLNLSTLIRQYTYGRPFASRLMRLVRYWSKICGLDRSDASRPGLSHHAFDIMVIHFLQRAQYLPVLHEIFGVPSLPKSENDHGLRTNPIDASLEEIQAKCLSVELKPSPGIGELFIKFLAHYCLNHGDVVQITSSLSVSRHEMSWMKKIFHIVDPFHSDNVVTFSTAFQPYFFNCFMATFTYLVVPKNNTGPIAEVKLFQKYGSRKMKSKNSSNALGNMQECIEDVISPAEPKNDINDASSSYDANKTADILRSPEAIRGNELSIISSACTERKGNNKLTSNEPGDVTIRYVAPHDSERADSFFLKHNMSTVQIHGKQLADMSLADHTLQGESDQYSADFLEKHNVSHPPSKTGDGGGACKPSRSTDSLAVNVDQKVIDDLSTKPPALQLDIEASSQATVNEDEIDMADCIGPRLPDVIESPRDNERVQNNGQTESVRDHLEEATSFPKNICREEFYVECDFRGTMAEVIVSHCANWTADDYYFDLKTKENFTGGFVCAIPDVARTPDIRPSLQLIPLVEYENDPTENEINDLCRLIEANYVNKQVTRQHIETADSFVSLLLTQLKKKAKHKKHEKDEIWADTRLTVFGSLRNGFGVNSSDVDLCLRFGEDYSHENASSDIMRQLRQPLRAIGCRYDNIQVILRCKVPIVKFVWWLKDQPEHKIDGDISYYNDLAIVNTELLCEYSNWGDVLDSEGNRKPRVKELGLWIKVWSKQCGIGDASCGSLSSYSHTLMMIHYLQNLPDPVLPRLQEQFREKNYKPRLINDCDTYFFKDNDSGSKRYNWSSNKMNVAELFIGFLDYYSQFDFANTVIQIRRKQTLSKLEKKWISRGIAIEDPFDLNHNLGQGVSAKMAIYIQNTFRRSRNVFHSSQVYKKLAENSNLGEVIEAAVSVILKSCVGDQELPRERVCTNCKQPGHRHSHCPKLNEKKTFVSNMNGNDMRGKRNRGFSNDANSRWKEGGKVWASRKDNEKKKPRFNNGKDENPPMQ